MCVRVHVFVCVCSEFVHVHQYVCATGECVSVYICVISMYVFAYNIHVLTVVCKVHLYDNVDLEVAT